MTRSGPPRAVVTQHRHPFGSGSHARRAPDPRLRGLLAREHVGEAHETAYFESWLEPPPPVLTLMVSLEDPLRTDRGTLPRAWIAGLDDRPEMVQTGGRHTELDLKLTPLGAHVLCAMPLRELTGHVVPLEDVFGAAAVSLYERLGEAADWDSRFDLIEDLLLRRAAVGRRPDPFVAEAYARLHASGGRLRVGQLAADLKVSRRHLSTRFHSQLGLPPKPLARLLRFERVRKGLETDPSGWAETAAACGYADQSHLNREFRELAATTPAEFLSRQLPEGGGTVGDGITFLQDGD